MLRTAQSNRTASPSTRRVTAVACLALVALSGCTSPAALADLNEQLNQAADAVNDIRINLSTMQGTVDSLVVVAARQDSIIVRLAAATNVQIIR